MGDTNEQESGENNGIKRDEKGRWMEGTKPGPGRPTGFSLVDILKRQLQEVPEGRQRTYAEELIRSILQKGIIEKDSQTHRLILNYVEGMPKQNVDLTSGGSPMFLPLEILNKNDIRRTDTSAEDNSE